jgi:hypothetical protein
MTFRKRRFGSNKYNAARVAHSVKVRADKRLTAPQPDYPPILPELRRKIIVEDYDFSEVVRHEILLYRTNRIDCYRVEIDGQELSKRMGWARVLEKIRKAFIRVSKFID